MTLINCSKCGKIVSNKAKACPHCNLSINQVCSNISIENQPATLNNSLNIKKINENGFVYYFYSIFKLNFIFILMSFILSLINFILLSSLKSNGSLDLLLSFFVTSLLSYKIIIYFVHSTHCKNCGSNKINNGTCVNCHYINNNSITLMVKNLSNTKNYMIVYIILSFIIAYILTSLHMEHVYNMTSEWAINKYVANQYTQKDVMDVKHLFQSSSNYQFEPRIFFLALPNVYIFISSIMFNINSKIYFTVISLNLLILIFLVKILISIIFFAKNVMIASGTMIGILLSCSIYFYKKALFIYMK